MIRTCRNYQVADHSAERELDHSSGAGTFTSANTGRSLEVHSEKHRHRNADKSLGDSGFGAVLRNKSIAKAPRRFANDTRDSDLCVVKM